MQRFLAFLLLTIACVGEAAHDLGWSGGDTDLTNFVTRPELKAPLFNVAVYDREKVESGYWFVGPYAEISQKPPAPKYYHACQTGPHIYDGNGNLVWSGACDVKNQNACDFRAWNFNGTDYLSTILYKGPSDAVGHGVIMDSSFRVVQEILPPPELPGFNMHELNLVNHGTAAMYFTFRTEFVNISGVPGQSASHGYIMNMGFREIDLSTGSTTFEWWAHPEVSLSESNVAVQQIAGPFPHGWNWFHGNSIVKNSQGDYLVSARYTDTVYKISGRHGNIIWRLGGRKSDFVMDGFNFSRQHDARWYEDECDGDIETISLLDNGSDGKTSTSNTSSGLKISLDTSTMTASLLQRWIRPDQGRSDLRGNMQHLPNGNVFVAWSDNSFISEHSSTGDLVMAGEFLSERFVTYRAYKFNFTGNPVEPPVLKVLAYGVDESSATTVTYLSWNGATEIDTWDVYHVPSGSQTMDLIGNVRRSGFETRLQAKGFKSHVYAEALAADGTVLGHTEVFAVEAPPEWGWEEVESEDLGGLLVDQAEGSRTKGIKTEL